VVAFGTWRYAAETLAEGSDEASAQQQQQQQQQQSDKKAVGGAGTHYFPKAGGGGNPGSAAGGSRMPTHFGHSASSRFGANDAVGPGKLAVAKVRQTNNPLHFIMSITRAFYNQPPSPLLVLTPTPPHLHTHTHTHAHTHTHTHTPHHGYTHTDAEPAREKCGEPVCEHHVQTPQR